METKKEELNVHEVPSAFNIIKREFKKDKIALFSFTLLVSLVVIIFISATFFLDVNDVMKVRLLDKYAAPLEGYWLGADYGGRSILGQLVIGARNSIMIGVCVTIITEVVGIVVGIVISYYGGWIEDISMRIIDFISVLPTTLLIIVFATIVPKYNVVTFILMLSIFYWIGTARLIRGKVLSEVRRDYISASKTMGTSDFKIIFRELLPNISSIIIVDMTLSFAGNLGIETGLTFLGYGLPPSTPSLGTLISYATAPDVLADRWWVWMPASFLILILMLCINYIGEALKRASDARQRLG
ncbi:ABC transporter permease [Pseudostreptobacillus hongkongensis]|uniref:ABC transporter permease n=1 Tax=Pseudostreptobacillus hongkongensis TaxID=1162717 RepID=UPI0028D4FC24|nr:ABC transporter permease [Pseudostreptobacillus hongkongensis]